jgi:hypothetical protein
VQHDNNVGAQAQSSGIAGLLIAAVSPVAVVTDGVQAKFMGQIRCSVGAAIVGENNLVDDVVRNLVNSLAQRANGIVGRQNNCDLSSI